MLIPEESVKMLVELGLTHTEAKVYIALLYLKAATARNIHKASNVARQDVYQTLSDLQDKGLIEKVIAKPAEYQAIPANDIISILLQRKNEKELPTRKKSNPAFQKSQNRRRRESCS
jgi:sugar-specific transcriptional regulator TrmB